ncbi:unnamed protein product [Urochloa humidicola]
MPPLGLSIYLASSLFPIDPHRAQGRVMAQSLHIERGRRGVRRGGRAAVLASRSRMSKDLRANLCRPSPPFLPPPARGSPCTSARVHDLVVRGEAMRRGWIPRLAASDAGGTCPTVTPWCLSQHGRH